MNENDERAYSRFILGSFSIYFPFLVTDVLLITEKYPLRSSQTVSSRHFRTNIYARFLMIFVIDGKSFFMIIF